MVMKRFCFSALAAVAAIGALSSCNGKLSSTTYDSDASFPAAEGSEYALEVRISAEYPVSGLKKAVLDNIDKVLTTTLFGDEYAAMEPEKAIEAYKADKAKEYRETNARLIKESEGKRYPVIYGYRVHVHRRSPRHDCRDGSELRHEDRGPSDRERFLQGRI